MGKLAMGLVMLLGCGGDDGGGAMRYDCDTLAKAVSQRHGTCTLARDDTDPSGMGCPGAIEAYCNPDGLEASCPTGWSVGCEVVNGQNVNCTYGTSSPCTTVDADTVSFTYVQTLNGIDGLGVMVTFTAPFQCEFRPCSPL